MAAFRAGSGQTVEYALASRSFLSADALPDGFSPNGFPLAETGFERRLRAGSRTSPSPSTKHVQRSLLAMTNTEQDRWSRVKGRLRSSVGEDVYTSWFARMDLESVQDESVHLSVPTRFLKSWIQAHYA